MGMEDNRTFMRQLPINLISSALCLVTYSLMIAPPATAQSNPGGSSTNSAQSKMQFEFEVVSIHPHKPGTLPFPMQFTPDGYKASETISEMIMRAYNPQNWRYWQMSKI